MVSADLDEYRPLVPRAAISCVDCGGDDCCCGCDGDCCDGLVTPVAGVALMGVPSGAELSSATGAPGT